MGETGNKVKRTFILFLIIFLVMQGKENDMAVIENRTSNRAVSSSSRGGGSKNNDTLAQKPSNYKADKPLVKKANKKQDDTVRNGNIEPNILDILLNAAAGGAAQNPVITGAATGAAVNNPALAGAATGAAVNNPALAGAAAGGLIQDRLPAWLKRYDQLAQRPSNYKPNYGMANTMKAIDTLQNKSKNNNILAPHTNTDIGFGSSYGGNWGGSGGGGYGGYGGYGGSGYDNYPSWLQQYLRLNSWNIR